MSTFRIEEFEPADATDAQLQDVNDLNNIIKKEELPEDPPTPVEEFMADVRSQVSETRIRRRQRLMRQDDGQTVAFASLQTEEFPENRHIVRIGVNVRPDYRRKGHALRMIAPLVAAAVDEKRELVAAYAVEGSTGEAFANSLGFELQLRQVLNRVKLADIDRGLMKSWIQRASERASDYSIEFWEGITSDENLEAFTQVTGAMRDAPRPEAVNDWELDPERIRIMEKGATDQGFGIWTMVARHRPSGEIGGHTQIWLSPWRPDMVYQGNTGVLDSHRNLGLGRWLKAAMVEKVFEELPEAKLIETGNAATNKAMLGINHEMGFRPALMWLNFMMPLEKLAAALAERGVG